MDIRLFEASQTGNVQVLHQLLEENPLLLHNVSLASGESPLHVASVAGHVDFVKEILRLKPAFAEEFNQDGFSPMHVASANGYLEIVRELRRVDPKLSQLKGRDQWTPLHYAARRGRVDIIRELVSACPESVDDVTVQGETAFHLGVKNSQFEAIRILVELVREMDKLDILNIKDNLGNSVLHLATWKKQHQVVEWLVGTGTAPAGVLEVTNVNQSGLTALDLLLVFPSEAGDREIEEILRGAGARRAREIVHSSPDVPSSSQDHNQMPPQSHQEQPNVVASRALDIVHSSSDVPSFSPNHNQMAPQTTHQEQPNDVALSAPDIVHPSSDVPSFSHNHIQMTPQLTHQEQPNDVASSAPDIIHPSSDVPSFSHNHIQMTPQLTHQEQPNDVASSILDIVHSVPDAAVIESHSQNHTQMASETPQEQPVDLVEYFTFKWGRDKPDDARTALLVVAVLVATATYDIALNPPGGLWQDTNLSKNGTDPPHLAGTSNIATYYPVYSIIGAVFNSIGFSVSLHMINILTTNFPLRLELQVCGLAMYLTYINGLITIAPGMTAGWYSLFALTPFLPPVVMFAARWVKKLIIKLSELLLNRMPILKKFISNLN